MYLGEVHKVICLRLNLLSEGGVVAGREGIAEHFDKRPVMHPWYTLHQVGGGVVAEVRREVANPQPPSRGRHVLGILVRPLL